MDTRTLAAAATLMALSLSATAQITFYERDGFAGRSFTTSKQVGDLERYGFNDRASSVIVKRDRWEVCEHARFGGTCRVLRPGRYPSLSAMGMNDRVSSVRIVGVGTRVEEHRYAPPPVVVYDARRRGGERLYQANVVAVRAVVTHAQQRCWVERDQVSGEANVPAAIAGAVIGGILGHQVGGGRGKDAATAGGAVAGAAIGANIGRDGPGYGQEVQRCTTSHGGRPDYWDVTYRFKGREHRVQMSSPPGRTITVNGLGEPRA
jgi:uncharacterized protein YcfJ